MQENDFPQYRFNMTTFPIKESQPGKLQEELTQWFLEKSFFKDFLYRNPKIKDSGKELADAVVMYDDVLLLIQVKAQYSDKEPKKWAIKKIKEALNQLKGSRRTITTKRTKYLNHEIYGLVPVNLEYRQYHFGLVIIAQQSQPFRVEDLVPEIATAGFPIYVFSLEDFKLVTSRFDTAGDFITYLELRRDLKNQVNFFVHNEENNMIKMIPFVGDVIKNSKPGILDEILKKTCKAFEEKITGKLLESKDWKYSLVVDDIIAHTHNVDSNLAWSSKNSKLNAIEIAVFLGYLTRDRRIKLGEIILENANRARDGENHYFYHFHRPSNRVFVFLATSSSREDRVEFMKGLVSSAQYKCKALKGLGVATEPIGTGRSYDFYFSGPQKIKSEFKDKAKELDERANNLWADGKQNKIF